MAVDMLRSCHRANFRYFENDPTVAKLRWYFCEPGALNLPIPTALGSNVWEVPELDGQTTGQFDRKYQWDKGGNDGKSGQNYVGDPQWYLTGVPLSTFGGALLVSQRAKVSGLTHPAPIGSSQAIFGTVDYDLPGLVQGNKFKIQVDGGYHVSGGVHLQGTNPGTYAGQIWIVLNGDVLNPVAFHTHTEIFAGSPFWRLTTATDLELEAGDELTLYVDSNAFANVALLDGWFAVHKIC